MIPYKIVNGSKGSVNTDGIFVNYKGMSKNM